MTQIAPSLETFRDRMLMRWTPPWLARGNNAKFMWSIAFQADVMAEAMVAAIASRFPGVYSYDTLPLIGRERRIARGPAETDQSYAGRLIRWLDDHRRRGNGYTLLAQIHAYHRPNNFPVELVYRSGRHFVMNVAGAITRGISPSFAPNTYPEQWARWWLFYRTDAHDLDNLPNQIAADFAHVPREWNAAHCIGTIVVMTTDAELWNWPLGHTWNEPGTWNTPGASRTIEVW
jgi:hypothetical protein